MLESDHWERCLAPVLMAHCKKTREMIGPYAGKLFDATKGCGNKGWPRVPLAGQRPAATSCPASEPRSEDQSAACLDSPKRLPTRRS